MLNLFSEKRVIGSDNDITDALQLLRSENIGPITYRNLVQFYGSPRAALDDLPELAKRSGRKKPYKLCPRSAVEDEIAAAQKIGATLIAHFNDAYPETLAAVDDAPPLFYALGNVSLMKRPCIGMVGARNASLNGIKMAEKLASDLGKSGQTIVSGLARGIDSACHRGSLETGTIAVVAGGIDIIYPPENKALYEYIAAKGLIVAECPTGIEPQARHFPRRNRIISAMSWATIVVEASEKSGSLITARCALEQGREVMAVPGSPLDPRSGGPNRLIREGAHLVTSAEDILAEYTPNRMIKGLGESEQSTFRTYNNANNNTSGENNFSDDEARRIIRDYLSPSPVEVNDLVRESGLSVGTVLTILLEFEIAGVVTRHSGNRVSYTESEE